jgi:dihydrofolate reductase
VAELQRKISVFAYVSLDGVMQPPGDDDYANGGWMNAYRSDAGAKAVAEAQGERFDLLIGRRTYDMWSGIWPNMKGGPFADAFNAATKFVVTHRPAGLLWGPAEPVGPDIAAETRRIRSTDGPHLIVIGSTTITPVLFDQGLVDEVVVIVYPVLLGRGKRFFSDRINPRELTLVNTKATPTSVLIHTYRHVGSLSRESGTGER